MLYRACMTSSIATETGASSDITIVGKQRTVDEYDERIPSDNLRRMVVLSIHVCMLQLQLAGHMAERAEVDISLTQMMERRGDGEVERRHPPRAASQMSPTRRE